MINNDLIDVSGKVNVRVYDLEYETLRDEEKLKKIYMTIYANEFIEYKRKKRIKMRIRSFVHLVEQLFKLPLFLLRDFTVALKR